MAIRLGVVEASPIPINMKTTINIKSIFVGALLGAALVFGVAAANNSQRIVWEYRVILAQQPGTMQREMNAAAAEGWEVVGVASDANVGAFTVFRRPKK